MKTATLTHSSTNLRLSCPLKLILMVILFFMVSSVVAQSDPNNWSFEDGIPGDWARIGTCGSSGADGVVGLAPGGGQQYGYCVTRADGPELPDSESLSPRFPHDLFANVPGETSTGSIAESPIFEAGPGDTLRFNVNYVTTDLGGNDADVAWVSLFAFADDFWMDILRLSIRSTSQDDGLTGVMPRSDMPNFIEASEITLTPENVSMNFGPPEWGALDNESETCAGAFETIQACGYSGWVTVEYTFTAEGIFTLQFGVVNMESSIVPNGTNGLDQSGIAFDGIEFIPAQQEEIFLVEALAGEGGSVAPSSLQVNEGESAVFTVTPEPGFEIDEQVGGTCSDPENPGSWEGNVYTTSPVTADCEVIFAFNAIILPYVVTATAGEGGTVDPESMQVVPGETASFIVVPNTGYERLDLVSGTCPSGGWAGNVYTTGSITTDCAVEFSFEAVPTIMVMAEVIGEGGGVSPPVFMAHDNQVVTFTLIPEPDYFRSLEVAGTCPAGQWVGKYSYETGPVTEDCSVEFSFDLVSELLRLDHLNLGMVFGDGQSYVVFDISNLASEDLGPVLFSAQLESDYEFAGWNGLLPSCRVEDVESGFGFVCDVGDIPPWICAFEDAFLECEIDNLPQAGIASLIGIVSGYDFNIESHMQAKVSLLDDSEEPAFELFQDCETCPIMVMIPAGTFAQGSLESEPQSQPTERPQRQVEIQAFAMGQTAVTFDQWDACVDDGGCAHVPDDNGWGRGNRPVINVSWNDAQEYVTWLSNKTGHDYRLPSESEREYATRAGTTGRFNTGDCITTEQANFQGGAPAAGCPEGVNRAQTLPVASFEFNAFGLYDTHGNTNEWVQDCWNENYHDAPTDGSVWMTGDCSRTIRRGGSSGSRGDWLRSAYRSMRLSRDERNQFTGFRVARSIAPPSFQNCDDCIATVMIPAGTL